MSHRQLGVQALERGRFCSDFGVRICDSHSEGSRYSISSSFFLHIIDYTFLIVILLVRLRGVHAALAQMVQTRHSRDNSADTTVSHPQRSFGSLLAVGWNLMVSLSMTDTIKCAIACLRAFRSCSWLIQPAFPTLVAEQPSTSNTGLRRSGFQSNSCRPHPTTSFLRRALQQAIFPGTRSRLT